MPRAFFFPISYTMNRIEYVHKNSILAILPFSRLPDNRTSIFRLRGPAKTDTKLPRGISTNDILM